VKGNFAQQPAGAVPLAAGSFSENVENWQKPDVKSADATTDDCRMPRQNKWRLIFGLMSCRQCDDPDTGI
jgi:hypothetical protein